MINFSPLPSRVRRIAKVYGHCIEVVTIEGKNVSIKLKEGYKNKEETAIVTQNIEEAIYFLKSVSKLASRKSAVALFSFKCQLSCGRMVQKGTNYIELGGMKICSMCGKCNLRTVRRSYAVCSISTYIIYC